MKYLARRLAFYLVAAWASITLAFIIPRLMPGDPAQALFARFHGKLKPEAIESLKEAFGFTHESLWSQYGSYLRHVLTGDLGVSVSYFPAKVGDVIATGLVWTLFLTGFAVVISYALGTFLGIVSAWRRRGWIDRTLPPLFVFLGAFPFFWLAMLLLFVFGYTLGWTPVRHAYGDDFTVWSVLTHAALPAITIVIATAGSWMLDMRNTMIGVLGEDYITLAHAKGLHPRRVMLRYAARNALLPNITGFGMALGFVLSGSLLTEIVFSYPGQGYLLIQAVHSLDYPLIQGLFLTITMAVLGANLLVDCVYVWLDPRARGGAK
ncbi:MAG TPA: ABC transporter permease [Kofleriaceae bacterium]|nr:ABC transporter permease [Kofleriaceae bacterium]